MPIATNSRMRTYQEIMDVVRELTSDPVGDSRLITDTQMDLWANMCLHEMVEHSEFLETEETANTTGGGTGAVAITGDPIRVLRVEIEDEAIYPTTTRDLYKLSRTWQAQTGRPRWYYMDSLRDYQSDYLYLNLWPLPNAVYSVRAVVSQAPKELDSTIPTNNVEVPLWATPGLVWGILYRFYEAETRMQSNQASQLFKMMYEDVVDRLKVRSYSKLGRSKAWGSGRRSMPSGDFQELMPSDGFPYP